jgi:hypothetical protein
MTSTHILLIALAAALVFGARAWSAREARPAGRQSTQAPRRQRAPSDGARRTVSAPIEWEATMPTVQSLGMDALRAKVRDRYIAARFPGVLHASSDLLENEAVIDAARHYFEEDRLDDAAELFTLAIEQSPQSLPLRLAQIEIAFLSRDAALFTELARPLREIDPPVPQWNDVARLGRALVPNEPLFGLPGAESLTSRKGPWPEMPNWIHASWDLTPEVLSAEFHRALLAHNGNANDPAVRRVA